MEAEKRVRYYRILSLFPDYFQGPFDVSIVGRARERGLIEIEQVNIRDFADPPHYRVDDRPYGGGPGMVMMVEPTLRAIRSRGRGRVIYLSPQGPLLTAQRARALAQEEVLTFLCGHYEGVDERVIQLGVDEELSIGDYVLTNGCAAAVVTLDAIVRFIPGVLGHAEAAAEDSFEKGHFDCPHYTRPEVYEDLQVPPVLLGGNHKEIAAWRLRRGREKTVRLRPDLLKEKKTWDTNP